jgi:anti-sigma factor RsiW
MAPETPRLPAAAEPEAQHGTYRAVDCAELLSVLSEYMDGETATGVCAGIDRHLAHCPNCRALVDTMRKTLLLVHALPPPQLGEDARQRLLHALSLVLEDSA